MCRAANNTQGPCFVIGPAPSPQSKEHSGYLGGELVITAKADQKEHVQCVTASPRALIRRVVSSHKTAAERRMEKTHRTTPMLRTIASLQKMMLKRL